MENEKNVPATRRAAISRRSTLQLALWTGAWVLTVALMKFGNLLFWGQDSFLNPLAIALNLALGLGVILAIMRDLKVQDEMARKVWFDAAAMTLGVGLVAGPAFEFYGGLPFALLQPQIPHLMILLGLTFLVSILVGWKRLQ